MNVLGNRTKASKSSVIAIKVPVLRVGLPPQVGEQACLPIVRCLVARRLLTFVLLRCKIVP